MTETGVKKRLELDAYHQANKRSKYLRRTGMLFNTPEGLLLIQWQRYGWESTWMPKPVELKVRQ